MSYRGHVTHYGEGLRTHCLTNSCFPVVTKNVDQVTCKTCLRVVKRGKLIPEVKPVVYLPENTVIRTVK